MKHSALLFLTIFAFEAAVPAQGQPVSDNYFPADSEFRELRTASPVETVSEAADIAKIDGGRLFLAVGFDSYARREYSIGDLKLSIEVVTLRDFRAAYSLLTLLRDSGIQNGPPGDAFTSAADGLRFAQDRIWVRIRGKGVSKDLISRVADSVSRRIGPIRPSAPSLVSHLPKLGYDASSLRYFPDTQSYQSYVAASSDKYFKVDSDMEIAQARYSLDTYSGIFSLLSFPTPQVAEVYFEELRAPEAVRRNGSSMYAKRTGPLVALLEGTFDPGTADKILNSVSFSYSIRWIREDQQKPTTVWGVPVGILGTVVKSMFFVVLLCVISIAAGAGFAIFRVILRKYAPNNALDSPERTEITRLRLR